MHASVIVSAVEKTIFDLLQCDLFLNNPAVPCAAILNLIFVDKANMEAPATVIKQETHGGRLDPWLGCGCVFVVLYWLVLYIPAPEAHIRAHDFLDVVFNYYILRTGVEDWFFNFDARLGALNGLPVSALALGDLSLPAALFEIFPPFEALAVLLGLLRLGGFIGLYLLLRDHVLQGLGKVSLIALVVALSFIFLSHMPSRFGNILLLPALLWALLNLWQRRCPMISGAICVGFPFVWAFIYGGYVIAAGIGVTVLAGYLLRAPRRHGLLLTAMGFGLTTLVAEARLFYFILFKPFESYRTTAIATGSDSSLEQMFLDHFLRDANGHHYVGQFPVLVAIVFGVIFYLVVLWAGQRLGWLAAVGSRQSAQRTAAGRLLLALAFTAGVSLAWAALRLYQPYIAETFHIPHRLDRVDILSPVLWRVDIALALAVLMLAGSYLLRRIVFVICLLGVGLFALQQQAYELKSAIAVSLGAPPYASLRALAQNALTGRAFSEGEIRFFSREGYPRLKDFFRIAAFRAVDEAVAPLGDRNSYRVLAIDLSPALLHFHGFQTLGGYFYEHALSYGADFAEMFAVELRKNPDAPAQPQPISKGIFAPIDDASRTRAGLDVDFDICRFRTSGGRLVFTPEPLVSAPRLGLALLTSVEDLRPQVRFTMGFRYYDKIFVYQISESARIVQDCPTGSRRLQHP